MEYKDYYKVLGVSKSADEKAVKTAYRKLARKYHPDQNPDNPAAEETFKDINEAYEVLGDADNRSQYDRLGANYHSWKQGGGAGGFQDFAGSYGGMNPEDLFGGDQGGFADILSSLFGQQAGGAGGFNQRRAQPLRQDTEQQIDVTLEEAYSGGSRILVDGRGERFEVKIPRGAKTGTKVRLRGKGNRGGDLYLIIRVQNNAQYERDGQDPTLLYTTVPVDTLTAILGGEVRVGTLKGAINLKIAPGTQGGQKVKLRGRGMPDLRQNDRYGDLMADIQISIPTNLSAEERELYEQLSALRPS